MTPTELQQWLVAHGQSLTVDGQCGPRTRATILAAFTNKSAPAVTDEQVAEMATRLACTVKQLRAVAQVESGGSAFDADGQPKMLFERHLFHRLTGGKWSTCNYSNPKGGGYDEDSWAKLTMAACKDAEAAFSAASWGRFQVLGTHWHDLGYPSPIELAYSTVESEAGSYELLARYIEHNGLRGAISALSTDPETCRPFAAAYNGPNYRKYDYHNKLARAMA